MTDDIEALRRDNERLRCLYDELLRSRTTGVTIAFSMVDAAQRRLREARTRFKHTRRT